MAEPTQLARLLEGVSTWNQWREQHKDAEVTLNESDLSGADLSGTDLSGADLTRANLTRADLTGADLSGAILSGANLGANLTGANLTGANLFGARLTGCRIYGISAWDTELSNETAQSNLIIEGGTVGSFKVDDIEVAQFVHLLRSSEKSRQIKRIRQVMAAIDLRTDDIVNRGATVLDAPSNNAGVKLEIEETNVMDQTEVDQNSAQSVDETKRRMRSAMAELPHETRNEVLNDLNENFLPSKPVMDRVWQIIIWAFAIVFVVSALALCAGALWMPDTAEIPMILTVVTTVAGFISGRASSRQPPS